MDRMTQIKETYLHKSGGGHSVEHRFAALGQKYEKPVVEETRLDSTADSEEREKFIFFYHPDHLNSTSFVTDVDGNAVQFVLYIPYGEVFVEERNSTFSSSYLFNAKELDYETGLYYYGARYLDPQSTLWLSVDPLWEKYPGVSPYSYCVGNPVRLVDPDGCRIVIGSYIDQFLYLFGYKTDFVKKVEDDLLFLKTVDNEVRKTIDDLENSSNIHNIVHTNKGNRILYDGKKANKGERQGSIIEYNEILFVPFNSRNQERDKRDPVVGLGHELKHSIDIDTGNLDDTIYPPSEIPQSEIDAVNFENRIRKKLDLPLRYNYGDKEIPAEFLEAM